MFNFINPFHECGEIYCKNCHYYYENFPGHESSFCYTDETCYALAEFETAEYQTPFELKTYSGWINRKDNDILNKYNDCKYFKEYKPGT